MADLHALWDFDDPAASEGRFREAAAAADRPDNALFLSQAARALGLRGEFDAGHALLDTLDRSTPEVSVRIDLERGRLLRSSGEPSAARPHFEAAANVAAGASLEALAVDALHMVALVVPPEEQIAANDRALIAARAASDPVARDWEASILNNLGMCYADVGDFGNALRIFEEALAARVRIGDPARIRVARWMVAWALRNLGRRDEALALQREIKAELDEIGEQDRFVDEELAILESG